MKPTLKEVKKYFKNAEIVECLSSKKPIYLKYITKKGFHDWSTKWWFDFENHPIFGNNSCLLFAEDRGYAKILTYKTPKYEITKEQILFLINIGNDGVEGNLKAWFPEVFKKELEVAEWYKRDGAIFKAITKPDETGKFEVMGFDIYGKWMEDEKGCYTFFTGTEIKATPQEVKTALIKECEKLGLVDGAHYLSPNRCFKRVLKFPLRWFDGSIIDANNYVIFDNGVFAKPIETITIQEAEKLLNKKIV